MSEGRPRSVGEIRYISEQNTSFILPRRDGLQPPPLYIRKDQGRLHGILQTFSRRRRDGTRVSVFTAFGAQPGTPSQNEKENDETQFRTSANNTEPTANLSKPNTADSTISRSASVSSLSSSEVSDTVALCPSVKDGSIVYYQRKSAALQKGGGRKFRARNIDTSKLTDRFVSRNRFRIMSKVSANKPYVGHRSPAKSTGTETQVI